MRAIRKVFEASDVQVLAWFKEPGHLRATIGAAVSRSMGGADTFIQCAFNSPFQAKTCYTQLNHSMVE
eukprot:2343694-Pleurochrysis_carterae.AAC.1